MNNEVSKGGYTIHSVYLSFCISMEAFVKVWQLVYRKTAIIIVLSIYVSVNARIQRTLQTKSIRRVEMVVVYPHWDILIGWQHSKVLSLKTA